MTAAKPRASIKGKVTDDGGIGIPDIDVCLFTPPAHDMWPSIRTAADGTYTYPGVPSGEYMVKLSNSNRTYVSEYFDTACTVGPGTPVVVAAPVDTLNVSAKGLPGGIYSLMLYVDGYVNQTPADIHVTAPGATNIGDVVLEQGGGIAGTVTGPGGVPVAGVTGYAAKTDGTYNNFGKTNASGQLSVVGLPTGT